MPSLLPELLGVEPSEPSPDARATRLSLRVPISLLHFEGHFPGAAILPGVVQVDWAVRLAMQHLNLPRLPFLALENLKFQSLVLPQARLSLTLRWKASSGQLEFRFDNAARTFSSGRIVFGSSAHA